MITALLLTSLTLAPTDAMATAQVQQAQQSISVWLSKRGDLRRGDRVRVYVRPEVDGYLLVLHAEPDGRIRVLFPLDPYDDNYVRGARDYEIEGRGGREAFRVYERDGIGTVFVAFSRDPFTFSAFVRDDHWDYRVFEQWQLTPDLDPETELTALTRNMAAETYFDYDLTSYFVGREVATTSYSYGYHYPYSYGVSFRFGNWYPWSWRVWAYSSSWVCSDPFWWDSYRCDPYYWGHWGYDPFWYRPWYSYRYAYAYYYYPHYYDYYYYRPVRYVYAGPERLVLRRYTFKPADRRAVDGGITVRRRFVAGAGGTRAVQTRASPDRVSLTRRTPTNLLTTDRRVAPEMSGTPSRRAVTSPAAPDRRSVRPDGWGITDGRRTVTPVETPRRAVPDRTQAPQREPAAQPQAPARRPTTAQPERRTTPRTTPAPDPKPVTPPTRRPSSGSTATPAPRRPTSQRDETPAPTRRTTPTERSTPARTTPSRSTPTPRSVPSRSAPAPRSTPSRATPSRPSTPSRATPSRPSTPSRATPSRPSTPSRATPSRPSTPSRATPSRPSTPSRTSPRRPSTPSRSAPSSGSSRRPGAN